MANDNDYLVVAYFADREAAEKAAQELKAWDKDNTAVKFGGMGIITLTEDGKLKTDEVGARETRKGAKWGAIVGATGGLLAGVLTGGLALIPGAIIGVTAGGLGGSLFHEDIGMNEPERARMVEHLKSGGVAVAVMVDDNEIPIAQRQLNEYGGDVVGYKIPKVTMEEFLATYSPVEAARRETAARFPDMPSQEQEDIAFLMGAASSLDGDAAEKLAAVGVTSIDAYLERAATPQGRAALAAETGYDTKTILDWANELDLARVRGVGQKYAALLHAAGVDTVVELAHRNPENLTQKLAEVNAAMAIVEQLPSPERVAGWVAQAKELPRLITY
jgi:uncharacterized membrane protein/predicted flap endonuclease-1-like 5' DNA nuclease